MERSTVGTKTKSGQSCAIADLDILRRSISRPQDRIDTGSAVHGRSGHQRGVPRTPVHLVAPLVIRGELAHHLTSPRVPAEHSACGIEAMLTKITTG